VAQESLRSTDLIGFQTNREVSQEANQSVSIIALPEACTWWWTK